MFRGSVKDTGYPLHSPVSLSFPLPCVTLCHHISTGLYLRRNMEVGSDLCIRDSSPTVKPFNTLRLILFLLLRFTTIYIYIYTCVCVCVYTYIQRYTHTHRMPLQLLDCYYDNATIINGLSDNAFKITGMLLCHFVEFRRFCLSEI